MRGSDAADKLLANLAPLRANRGLGVLPPAKLKELGLDATKKRITLTLRSGRRSFTIAPAPPGGTLPYLRDEASGHVYVVGRGLLSDFQAAASLLVERRLHAFRVEDADQLRITAGSIRREVLVSRGAEQTRLAFRNRPQEPDAALKTWHDRVFSVWPAEVLGKGEAPVEGTPEIALRIDYNARGRSLGFVELGKVAPAASSAEAAKPTWFARSERTLGWVKLGSDAQSLLSDLPAGLR